LSEIGEHIKSNSEYYRSHFTTSDKKINISVPTGDPQLISLELITEGLRKLVPSDIDLFLPKFTTSTKESSLAFMSVFADTMTPFYSYFMYMCGIPRVKILGTDSDWELIINNLRSLMSITDKITKYLNQVIDVINNNILNKNVKNIFSIKKCGSGGQVEVNGWITKLFMKIPSVRYVENYPTCVSRVPYLFESTGQNFELSYGLFSSNEQDGYLIPDFGFVINEIKK
jgi:hypothetical protein